MGAKKIVDEDEVLTWFAEGRTYAWMQQTYRDKYGIETGLAMWGNYRRRRGLERRIERNDDLIPWAVAKEHRWAYPVMMLRAAARQRAGLPSTPVILTRLASWLNRMERDGLVVDYDPAKGFSYVLKQPGDDLIRKPKAKTTTRRKAN